MRGPNIVDGYWNKPEATAAAFTDGWFHTGDLGRRDDDGFVYVVDRLKDVVIRGGENVYSAEVEAVLFEHPAVARRGDRRAARRALRRGGRRGRQPPRRRRRSPARAAGASRPSGWPASRCRRQVFLRTEPLPRTATGKVLKRELRDELTAGAPS